MKTGVNGRGDKITSYVSLSTDVVWVKITESLCLRVVSLYVTPVSLHDTEPSQEVAKDGCLNLAKTSKS